MIISRFRANYWSCSKFADWVRGELKPHVLGMGEWDNWRSEVSSRRPLRFFLAETGLNSLQNLVMFPLDFWRSLRNAIRIRFFVRPHLINTGLDPWNWCDLDERMLHGLFNELKDFVEVELAGQWGNKGGSFKFRRGRCPEAGVAHLEWKSSLKYGRGEGLKKGDPRIGRPTPQASSAKKILKLYRWWLERPNRPDPTLSSGWSDAYDEGDQKKRFAAFKRLSALEDEYENEDEKMLVRLVRLRKHLWT